MMTRSRVAAPPFFSKKPSRATRAFGDRFTFASRAGGTSPLTYQWFKDEVQILEATSISLTLSNLTPADSGNFTVRASNSDGSVTSVVATLTVVPDPAPDVRQGLISWWPMEDQDQDAFSFLTPDLYSHNTMRLLPPSFFGQPMGAFGFGLGFNGVDQYAVRMGGFPIYNNPA